MKKGFKILIFVLAFFLALPLGLMPKAQRQTFSAEVSEDARYEEFLSEVSEIVTEFSKFDNRIAGTIDEVAGKNEADAANYIKLQLDATPLSPKNNTHVSGGVQKFSFLSDFSGIYQTSNNIVYEYKVNDSPNKIMIGTSYDAFAVEITEEEAKVVGVDGINDSAGSVATLIYLARHIEELNLKINVEIAFFGAGGSSNAGSKFYVQGLDAEEQKNMLCMINLKNISIGKNLYFYVDEFENDLSKMLSDLNGKKEIEIKQIDLVHLNKVQESRENSLGLGYTHLALDSNNFNFMKNGITSVNIFAGDYESGIIVGSSEYSYLNSITHTENDNLAYINEHYDENTIYKNMFKVYSGLSATMTHDDLVSVLVKSQGQNAGYYNFFANSNLALILTVVAFGIMICVAIVIYFHLTKKSYYADIEMEFLSTIVKITDGLGEKDGDYEVTKIVSQTIAGDIKKDKMIKPKKKKNK